MKKTVYHWRQQLFAIGDTVEIMNPRCWWKYPRTAKIVGIKKNKYGRVSYKIEPPATDEKGKVHDTILLEEFLPAGALCGP